MAEKNASLLVLDHLDEIAWLLNLRGSDIPFNPVFFAYLIISRTSVTIFIDPDRVTDEIIQHLDNELDKSYKMEPYQAIFDTLKSSVENLEGLVWISETTCRALTMLVPPKSLHAKTTPVALAKTIKNPVEIEGMKRAHVKDAAALCGYFAWLEKTLKGNSEKVTEISGVEKCNDFRARQADHVGPSFDTISSVGPHGAIIHYRPEESSDVPITNQALYLCDSGGQYKDGTTDITRTLHFGQPTDYERECFTRVLKGQIGIATAIFPAKISGKFLDAFARKYLWEVGLDYLHGTGHGVGAYLNVHEGPIGILSRETVDDQPLEPGMFLSNEPGFYENGKFGIRIEDVVLTVKADLPHNFNNRGFLKFETVSLVPIQTKMIVKEMLTEKEIQHLNNYHRRCRELVGPLLDAQGNLEAKEWLWRETEPI